MAYELVSVLGDEVTNAECGLPSEAVHAKGVALTVFAGGIPIHINGGVCTSHPYGSLCIEAHAPTLVASSATVTVEGQGIGRLRDTYLLCTGIVKGINQITVFAGD